MSINRSEVESIARLANLEFEDEELESFVPQFQEIIDYFAQLEALPAEHMEPLYHCSKEGDLEQLSRADEVRPSLARDEALRNAPEAVDGHFRVPRVIE